MLAGWNYYVTGTRWVDVRCYALRHLAMHPEIPRPILSEHCLEEVIRHPGETHDPKRVRPTGQKWQCWMTPSRDSKVIYPSGKMR